VKVVAAAAVVVDLLLTARCPGRGPGQHRRQQDEEGSRARDQDPTKTKKHNPNRVPKKTKQKSLSTS
jgi:hypothetical protein